MMTFFFCFKVPGRELGQFVKKLSPFLLGLERPEMLQR